MTPPVVRTINGRLALEIPTPTGAQGPNIYVTDNEPHKATYSVFGTFTPAATPTDVAELRGAAGKIIRLKRIIISGAASAGGNVAVSVIRRSTLNTGGTLVNLPIVTHDTANLAPAAVYRVYSANPSALGTSVGALAGSRLHFTHSLEVADRLVIDFSRNNDKAPVLRSATESFGINLGGATLPGSAALDIWTTWTEES